MGPPQLCLLDSLPFPHFAVPPSHNPTMSTLSDITTEAEFDGQITSAPANSLLVLYFHTPWAAPCTQMRNILSTLAATYPPSPSAPVFLSLDAEELPDISERYDVSAVPFIALQKDGKIVETVSGSDAARVRAAVERHAGSAASNASAASKTLPPVQTVAATPTAPAPNGTDTADPAAAKEELHTRLSSLVQASPVMLFMKGTPSAPQCGFSRQLVGLLREHGVRYGFFNILADDEVRQGLKEFADWPTFPQLWTKGELVGGLDIVSRTLSEPRANTDGHC